MRILSNVSCSIVINYAELVVLADEVIILSEYYYTRCFLDRVEFMVENASLLIAFYDGR